MPEPKTFVNTVRLSVHGTKKAAEAKLAGFRANPASDTVRTVEHVGPRQFAVISTTTITSTPAQVRHIMDGSLIVCNCGSDQWYYTGRSLFNLNYECASCERKISPVSETGASQ